MLVLMPSTSSFLSLVRCGLPKHQMHSDPTWGADHWLNPSFQHCFASVPQAGLNRWARPISARAKLPHLLMLFNHRYSLNNLQDTVIIFPSVMQLPSQQDHARPHPQRCHTTSPSTYFRKQKELLSQPHRNTRHFGTQTDP